MFRFLFSQLKDFKLIIKYVISGSIAAVSQLSMLAFLVEKINMWHLEAVVLAFTFSAIIAFFLQKFWTFRDHSLGDAHRQLFFYIILASLGLSLNVLFMYIFVDIFHIWYIIAQVMTMGIVVIIVFLCNKYIIFNRNSAIFKQKDNNLIQ